MTIIEHVITQVVLRKIVLHLLGLLNKHDGTVDDAEDLYLVMQMYNLLEYSSSDSNTAGSLWFSSIDQSSAFNADIAYNNNSNCKLFGYKAKLLKVTVAQHIPNNDNEIVKNANNGCSIEKPKQFSMINWTVID